MTIGLVDFRAGNRTSVENALRFLKVDFTVVESPEALARADRVVFPGVGEARAAMEVLAERGLDVALREAVAAGKPVLGICVGCQVLLERSEERDAVCLGIVPGVSKRFAPAEGLKVPQIGWNQVAHRGRHWLFDGIPDGASFYFVHSYYPAPDDRSVEIADTDYGLRFTSAFAVDNLVAVQFHPEKSGRHGLRLLSNFAFRKE